jgi:RNA-splicing ligase RtcB
MTITGKHLIDMGYEPAKWFGKAIEYINNNEVPEDQLSLIIESFIPKNDYNVLVPHQQPVQYDKFLDAVNEEELFNLISVEQTMDVVMMTPTVVSGAIMPDACPSGKIGHIPVGGLVVTDNAIHPSMHSADICCSVMITGFGENSPQRILNTIHNLTEFGGGGRRKAQKFHLPDELYKKIDNNRFFSDKAKAMAVSHLGTQGDGNHFSFVGTSKKTGETCLVTHHGSRGFGANLYKEGLYKAEQFRQELSSNSNPKHPWIPFDTKEGQDYWEALQITREWTKLNHKIIHSLVKQKVFSSCGIVKTT